MMNKRIVPDRFRTQVFLASLGFIAIVIIGLLPMQVMASSHMDAPLITLDDAANTTDVYAFVSSSDGIKYLTTALSVYPFETPGIGPNKHNFDDNVLYEIHVATGNDLFAGEATISYQFLFQTTFKNEGTILQSYLGVIQDVDDANQNLTQTYTVTRVNHATGEETVLGTGIVPPNNQGIATPFYNRGDDGERPAKDGVASAANLDRYTAQTIADLSNGYRSFAGQREDGFYADIQSIFDLLQLRDPGIEGNSFDSQSGFNVHTIVLNIPVDDIGGEMQIIGVYATTSRRTVAVLRDGPEAQSDGEFVQVGRQGNPLFNEALVGITDKDLYNRSAPSVDADVFSKYAETPELAVLINAIIFGGEKVAVETDRTDLVGIFIPDLIKVDLSTGPARLAGGGPNHPTNPDDEGFSRLGIFGDDVLISQIQGGFGDGVIPGGWPSGRRFGDDVIDIAVTAVLSDLRDPNNLVIVPADGIDNVSKNDSVYNKVFPYAGTPHNGRNYRHNPGQIIPESDNTFFVELDAGLNMISLPLQPPKPMTARSLMEQIGATIVIELDSKRQLYRGFTGADSGDGFPIEGARGYVVNMPQARLAAFVGSPWRNQPTVSSAPPSNATSNAWAFILAANVEEVGDMTLTVHNPRTGTIQTMASTDVPGNLHAVWTDLSRRSVAEVGDVLEIEVRDGTRQLVGVLRYQLTPEDTRRAFAVLHLTPRNLRPARTVLLANYPNPFNPETWMPYQLASDTGVRIRIYDATGHTVRTLDLGYQTAGYYLDKSRAAYWDGRNETGELMASGVYFYQLVADDATATRKLVIMK